MRNTPSHTHTPRASAAADSFRKKIDHTPSLLKTEVDSGCVALLNAVPIS
jgi:hypothetical protein